MSNEDASQAFNFLIPAAMVGTVIGTGGSTIREIVRQTSCRITVASQGARPIVVLIGTVPDKLRALRDIHSTMLQSGSLGVSQFGAELSVLIPDTSVGLILGKSGSYIQQIVSQSGAQLSFAREKYPEVDIPDKVPRSGPLKELSITGPFDAIQFACEMILGKLDEDSAWRSGGRYGGETGPPSPMFNTRGTGYYHQQLPQMSQQMQPMGQFMGEATGHQMQHMGQPMGEAMGHQMAPMNQMQQMAQMQQMGQPHMAQGQPCMAQGQPHMAQGQPHMATFQQQPAFPCLMISIPKEQVGGFIGKAGANVRDLENRSGARISVKGSKGSDETASVVTFTGTVEENVLAYKLTVQRLAELH